VAAPGAARINPRQGKLLSKLNGRGPDAVPAKINLTGRSDAATEGTTMADSVYKIIELVGTSDKSWEQAAEAAVSLAGDSLRDLRVAEVTELDMVLKNGKVNGYRAKVKVSFKYEGGD